MCIIKGQNTQEARRMSFRFGNPTFTCEIWHFGASNAEGRGKITSGSFYQKYPRPSSVAEPSAGQSMKTAGVKSCRKSRKHLDFTLQASRISRKINYDVTQSRPEGAASLHTPKNPLHPLLPDDSKQNRSSRAGAKRREREDWGCLRLQLHR